MLSSVSSIINTYKTSRDYRNCKLKDYQHLKCYIVSFEVYTFTNSGQNRYDTIKL